MNKSRIHSVIEAVHLTDTTTGFNSFDPSRIAPPKNFDVLLPTNLRLGHLAERIFSAALKASATFHLIDENIQIIENKQTIGELDFILEDLNQNQILHVELAYKFYLFDPTLSSDPTKNWIGPNRKDSLIEKLEKLKNRQFPLLYHPYVQARLTGVDKGRIEQQLCFLASLYLPFEKKVDLPFDHMKAVKGFYLDLDTFQRLDESSKSYYIPMKTEWGMDPSGNKTWMPYADVRETILKNLAENRAPMCWQKQGEIFSEFFIVWW